MEREPDWKSMYMALLGKVNDALAVLPLFPENIKIYRMLEAGMQAAEDIYCGEAETPDRGGPETPDGE